MNSKELTSTIETLQPDIIGINCWLLKRDNEKSDWKIFRVINNDSIEKATN